MRCDAAFCPPGLATLRRRFAGKNQVDRTSRPRGWRDVRRLFAASYGLASMAALVLMAAPVQAQVGTDAQRAPTLTIERYPEDWSRLADPAERTGHWTERFKYIPLSESGSTYLTTGVEIRSRYEGYEDEQWGAAPDNDYVWHRVMPYADLHVGAVRLFSQPIISGISGNDVPNTPVDTTGADMLQAFAEVEMDVAQGVTLRASAGRKLVSLGAGRLIDKRYGPNVPLAFDGLDASLTGASRQVRVMFMRPVDSRPGDMDDRASRQEVFWGVYATQWLTASKSGGFDLYYLALRDRNAVFDQGAGREVVHSLGGRIFGDTGDWRWNVEGVVQRGSFAGGRVEAWGVGGEIARRFRRVPLAPELAVTLDIISGDGDPDDNRLGTFNPLFPRGKYFAAQSPVGPRNLIHLQPSFTVHPSEAFAVSLTGIAYWRESTGDGLYNIPGFLVRSGRDSDARFIGKQGELAVAWQTTPELNLSASVSLFAPGAFIRDTGPARTIHVAGAAANFRF